MPLNPSPPHRPCILHHLFLPSPHRPCILHRSYPCRRLIAHYASTPMHSHRSYTVLHTCHRNIAYVSLNAPSPMYPPPLLSLPAPHRPCILHRSYTCQHNPCIPHRFIAHVSIIAHVSSPSHWPLYPHRAISIRYQPPPSIADSPTKNSNSEQKNVQMYKGGVTSPRSKWAQNRSQDSCAELKRRSSDCQSVPEFFPRTQSRSQDCQSVPKIVNSIVGPEIKSRSRDPDHAKSRSQQ